MDRSRTHYDYQVLDRLVTDDGTPEELGNHLDEIMQALAAHASQDGGYHTRLEEHYFILRTLRDIFWRLEEVEAWR